jgi:hypothetical protein
MNINQRKNQFLVNLLVISVISGFLLGCATKGTTWNLKYEEKVIVSTEPSGAHIYVQDHYAGISPVEVTLNGGDLKVWQMDSSLTLKGNTNGGYWIIKAFMDGYAPASIKITSGQTTAFQTAIKELCPIGDERRLPSVVVGRNAVVLYLPKEGMARENNQSGLTGESNSNYEQAKQEYEEALSAYKKAMEDLDEARNLRDINSLGATMGGDKNSQVMGLISQGSSIYLVRDAETKVRIARERLELAKSRLER